MRKLELQGVTFGRLIVICQSSKRTSDGRLKWHCLCDCGANVFVETARLRNGNTRSCGCLQRESAKQRRRQRSPNWRGGKHKTKAGYIRILTENGYRFEHVVVMESKLGRRLLPHETVHHKNGQRDDNQINNLELWSCSHPQGQRVVDKIEWAKQILTQYGYDVLPY